MRSILMPAAALALALGAGLGSAPAQAGCPKDAAVGAVVGHMAGHGVAGAAVRTLEHPLDGADVARMVEVGGMEVEAQQVAGALKKQGTPVWMMTAKDEGHGFGKKSNQQFQFYATILYMREYLLK